MVDCFKVSLSPADDERLSVSSSRQRVSLVTRQSLTRSEWVPCISFGSALPTHASVLDGNPSIESLQNPTTPHKNRVFSAPCSHSPMVWSVLDLSGSGVLGSIVGSRSGTARAILGQNGPQSGVPDTQDVGRCLATFGQNR